MYLIEKHLVNLIRLGRANMAFIDRDDMFVSCC